MNAKTLKIAGSAIIAILLMTAGIVLISNEKNKRNFKDETILNVSLASQKLQTMRDLDKAKSDISTLTSKEETSGKALADAEKKLVENGNRISYLTGENISLKKDKNDLNLLQNSKMELDNAYSDLKIEHQAALSRIRELENSAILLDAEKKDLTSRIENEEKYKIDNIEIFGSRGNRKDRLVSFAHRTKKLNLSFDSPLNLKDAISYRIITPSGKIINPGDQKSAWVVKDLSPIKLTASLSTLSAEPDYSRKIELKDNSKDKLKPGEYKIQIFSNDKNIGNYRLKFR